MMAICWGNTPRARVLPGPAQCFQHLVAWAGAGESPDRGARFRSGLDFDPRVVEPIRGPSRFRDPDHVRFPADERQETPPHRRHLRAAVNLDAAENRTGVTGAAHCRLQKFLGTELIVREPGEHFALEEGQRVEAGSGRFAGRRGSFLVQFQTRTPSLGQTRRRRPLKTGQGLDAVQLAQRFGDGFSDRGLESIRVDGPKEAPGQSGHKHLHGHDRHALIFIHSRLGPMALPSVATVHDQRLTNRLPQLSCHFFDWSVRLQT